MTGDCILGDQKRGQISQLFVSRSASTACEDCQPGQASFEALGCCEVSAMAQEIRSEPNIPIQFPQVRRRWFYYSIASAALTINNLFTV